MCVAHSCLLKDFIAFIHSKHSLCVLLYLDKACFLPCVLSVLRKLASGSFIELFFCLFVFLDGFMVTVYNGSDHWFSFGFFCFFGWNLAVSSSVYGLKSIKNEQIAFLPSISSLLFFLTRTFLQGRFWRIKLKIKNVVCTCMFLLGLSLSSLSLFPLLPI